MPETSEEAHRRVSGAHQLRVNRAWSIYEKDEDKELARHAARMAVLKKRRGVAIEASRVRRDEEESAFFASVQS